jgi:hypothetical protein
MRSQEQQPGDLGFERNLKPQRQSQEAESQTLTESELRAIAGGSAGPTSPSKSLPPALGPVPIPKPGH